MTDAWRQLHDLYDKHTEEWLVRPDLRVRAIGPERCVELALGERRKPPLGEPRWHFDRATQRNVATMRELADALNAAADFVEAANPAWANRVTDEGGNR